MDEFGSALRRVSEVGRRKRMDAPAASVSRLQYGHSLARAGEFAGGHQACGACADDDDVVWTWSGHAGDLPVSRRVGTRVLDPVPQQHRAAFKSLAALQGHRRDGGAAIGLRIRGVEHARCTLRAVHGWTQDQIELVDQSRAQKGTVGTAASLQQQSLRAQFAIEYVQRKSEIDLRLSGKDVGHALAAEARQVRIRNRLGQDDNDRIATDVRTAPADLAVRVEHHAVGLRVASHEPGLARKGPFRRGWIRLALGELLFCDGTDQPRGAGELVVNLLEQVPARYLGAPTTMERPTVHTGGHEADDVRFHANPCWMKPF